MIFNTTIQIKRSFPACALLTLASLYAATGYHVGTSYRISEQVSSPTYATTNVKWSYDEMARKLVMQNGPSDYNPMDQEIASGFGHALRNVSRQIHEQEQIRKL